MQEAQSLLARTERVEFARRLNALMDGTQTAMDIQAFAAVAVYSAIFSATQPDTPLNIGELKTRIEAANARTRRCGGADYCCIARLHI